MTLDIMTVIKITVDKMIMIKMTIDGILLYEMPFYQHAEIELELALP
jgi:hypothetical protein